MGQRGRPARILHVEDSVADAKLVGLALEESGGGTELVRVHDVAEALEFLDGVSAGTVSRPDLVVTDLELPRGSGIDVIRRIRTDPRLHTLPVVVFSTSRDQVDVSAAYECGASAYVVKPLDLHRFCDVVQAIESYWTGVVTLP